MECLASLPCQERPLTVASAMDFIVPQLREEKAAEMMSPPFPVRRLAHVALATLVHSLTPFSRRDSPDVIYLASLSAAMMIIPS